MLAIFVPLVMATLSGCENNFETQTLDISEQFQNISVNADSANLFFISSNDESCRVVCEKRKKARFSAKVDNNELQINFLFRPSNFSIKNSKITVYLPNTIYNNMIIESDTGDVQIENINVIGDLSIKVDTGDVNIKSCTPSSIKITDDTGNVKIEQASCKTLNIDVGTGHTSLTKTYASESLNITSDTGNVNFKDCDSNQIFVTTDTGDIKGNFLTEKIIFARSDTGRIDVPNMTTGGRCELETDTGNIKITIN